MITFDYQEIQKRLAEFFEASEIRSFPMQTTKDKSKGLAAFYIDNRAVQERLSATCVWRNEFKEGPQGGLLCGISILVAVPTGVLDDYDGPIHKYEWITRWDGADNTDIEAVKGGLSGSMRRAAVQWGIGRYLYDVPGQWVPLKNGRYFAKDPVIPSQFTPGRQHRKEIKQTVAPEPPAETKSEATGKHAMTPDQLSAFKAAGKGVEKRELGKVYRRFESGEIGIAEALREAEALHDALTD